MALPTIARTLRTRLVSRCERLILDVGMTLLAIAAGWGMERAMGTPAALAEKPHHRGLGFSIGFRRH